MTNTARGEATVEFKGENLTLKLTMNAMCIFETETGNPIGAALDEFSTWATNPARVNMTKFRLLFWALMLDARPESTVEDAGEVIAAFPTDCMAFMAEAIMVAMPNHDRSADQGK